MAETVTTRCCIAGGGPAGMMLGFLLARAGIDVIVLEKHKDFFRDFRGDTIHPSTLELMHELGLLDEFLKVPHQEVSRLTFQVGAERISLADLRHLPTHCKFVALMPQWDFLDFLAKQGRRYPHFHLRMETEATGGHVEAGQMLVMLNRHDYWQCAYVIPKGGIETVKREGLAAFRDRVSEIEPFLKDRVGELKSFDDVKLLTVAIDRLRQWHRPGLLCIGDAAHAMSPVGGVPVNPPVQAAVPAPHLL